MTHPPTNPPSDPGGGSTGPGRTTDPLPQTGAAVGSSVAANGASRSNGISAPAGDSEHVVTVLGSPVPLASISRPMAYSNGQYWIDDEAGVA